MLFNKSNQILNAIAQVDDKVDRNNTELKTTLYGIDGTSGLVHSVANLETKVCDPETGLVKETVLLRESITGKNGINTEIAKLKLRQRIWNTGFTITHAVNLFVIGIGRLFT